MKQKFKILRVAQAEHTTLSHLYMDGIFICYLLEDTLRKRKIKSVTAIPAGKYRLQLNTTGKMHHSYLQRFGEKHKGMVEIARISNFTGVFFHTGNFHTDTSGCPLTGFYWQQVPSGDYFLVQSKFAYEMVYEQLYKGALACAEIEVTNQPSLKLY